MSKTGEFFASIMMDPKFAANTANDSRWLRVGNGAYLILRKFNDVESGLIDEGLMQVDKFRFGDMGNLMFEDSTGEVHKYENPIDVTKDKDFDTRSLKSLRESVGRQYIYDNTKIISRSLRFILYKKENTWYLLYNAIHSREFSKYYKHVIQNASNVSWGATTFNVKDEHVNLNRVFDNYCDAFVVTHEGGEYAGKKSYLDPVCNMIKSEHQAQRTALFDTALVCPGDSQFLNKDNCEYDESAVDAAAPVLTQLGSGDPKYCLCMGGVHNFIDELESSDFIHDFEGRRECSKHRLELNFCSVINKAENLNINGSEMVTNCGGNVGAGAGRVGDSGLTETAVDTVVDVVDVVDDVWDVADDAADDVWDVADDVADDVWDVADDAADEIVPSSSPSLLQIGVVSLALGGLAYMLAKKVMPKPKTEKIQ